VENVLAALAKRVPLYAQRLLLVPCGQGELAAILPAAGFEVHGLDADPDVVEAVRPFFKSATVGSLDREELPFREPSFDCVVLSALPSSVESLKQVLINAVHLIQSRGCVLMVEPSSPSEETLRELAQEVGLEIYVEWDIPEVVGEKAGQTSPSPIKIGGLPYQIKSEVELQGKMVPSKVLFVVRKDYDPLAHAREVFLAGKPELSFEILGQIPSLYLEDPAVRAAVAGEKAACLTAWDRTAADGQTLERFQVVQMLFFEATSLVPHLHQAYHCYAEFWHRVGDDDMARRVLRSIHHVAPNPVTESQLTAYRPEIAKKFLAIEPPEWTRGDSVPRVLFITDEEPNHGLDVLFDGLCTVLGKDHVVEYPWKPGLHGRMPERYAYYPCLFNYPGGILSFEELLEALRQGQFDLVLFGDLEQRLSREKARAISQAAAHIPLFIVDMLDSFRDNRTSTLDFLGRQKVDGYFKRERLVCLDYGPQAFPMPLAYPASYIPERLPEERPLALFWGGNRQYGMRKLYLEYLEATFDLDLSDLYLPKEYVRMMQASRIGLDIPGFGFDTVRYWEVPAHGAMLLAERRPIIIPNNFRDRESAVFYEDLADLEDKLRYYLSRPEECAAIAKAGREHLLRYHTGTERARQLLGWVYNTLGW